MQLKVLIYYLNSTIFDLWNDQYLYFSSLWMIQKNISFWNLNFWNLREANCFETCYFKIYLCTTSTLCWIKTAAFLNYKNLKKYFFGVAKLEMGDKKEWNDSKEWGAESLHLLLRMSPLFNPVSPKADLLSTPLKNLGTNGSFAYYPN